MIFEQSQAPKPNQKSSNRVVKQELFLQRTVFLLNIVVLGGLLYLTAAISVKPSGHLTPIQVLPLFGAALILFIASIQLIRLLGIRQKALSFDQQALLDELTGTLSPERFGEILQEEIRRAGRYHYPLTLCTLDLDDFSSYAKHFGREGANKILRKFGTYFLGSIRSTDKLARIGEDKFTLLLPHTDLVRSEKVLSRILNQSAEKMDVSFSVGLTSYRAGESLEQFELRSKLALEEAKKAGKKRIRCIVGHEGGHSVLEF